MSLKLRKVDPEEEADVLTELHRHCFAGDAPMPDWLSPNIGWWWIMYDGFDPMAFCGLKSDQEIDAGYLYRAGVREDHRGKGLQMRLIRVRERKARELGHRWMISDTTDTLASANTLIKAGYRLYQPINPWGFKTTLYWKKELQ